MNVLQLRGGISCQCFMTLMQEFSTIKEIYLDSKINSIIYPHLKCIKCYMNDNHFSIFASPTHYCTCSCSLLCTIALNNGQH